MPTLQEVLKTLNKEYGQEVLTIGMDKNIYSSIKRIPFSSARANYMTYGGIPRSRIIEFAGEEGSGKAQPLYSKILTSSGYVLMKDIKLGDKVAGEDGNFYDVIGIFPQGLKPIYRITFSDNAVVDCSNEHLWNVKTLNEDYKTVTLDELLTKDLYTINSDTCAKTYNYYIPLTKPIQFSYSSDEFYHGNYEVFQNLNFIPLQYKQGDIKTRIKVLSDIVNKKYTNLGYNTLEYTTTNKTMALDIKFIVQSLGGISYITLNIDPKKEYADSYTVFINLANLDVNIIQNKNKTAILKPFRAIKSIEYVGVEECQCIKVSNPTELYITDQFIVTHNTTTALDIIANAQQLFKLEYNAKMDALTSKQDKLNKSERIELETLEAKGPQRALFIDAENTLDLDWAELLGVQLNELILYKPQQQCAEEIFEDTLNLINTGEVGIVVLDSLGVLISGQAYEKSIEERTYGGISMALTLFSKKVAAVCNQYNCTFIGINQVRDNMNSPYGGVVTTGGRGWRHNCSVRVMFRKGDLVDYLGDPIKKSSESPCGNRVMIDIIKTKCFRPDRRVGYYTLNYLDGIDSTQDLFDLSLKYNYIEKGGAWFTFKNPDTNEPITTEEGILKVQGKKNVLKILDENMEIRTVLENKIKCLIEDELQTYSEVKEDDSPLDNE